MQEPTTEFSLLFSSPTMVVVNKPPFVSMDVAPKAPANASADHPQQQQEEEEVSAPDGRQTVVSWAYVHLKSNGLYDAEHAALEVQGKRRKQVKFCHQLDHATSGVLAVAFTKPQAAQLTHCFEMRQCSKWYLAVLSGHLAEGLGGESHESAEGDGGNGHGPSSAKATAAGAVVAPRGRGDDDCGGGGDMPCGVHTVEWKALYPDMRATIAASLLASSPDGQQGESQSPRFIRCVEGQEEGVGSGGSITNTSPALALYQQACESLLGTDRLLAVNLPVGHDTTDPSGFRMGTPSINSGDNGGCGDVSSDSSDSRYAFTLVHVLGRGHLTHPATGRPTPVTKVLLLPRTGRRHQLRVHCAKGLGCPILGDEVYEAAGTTDAKEWPRMCLHAWRLAFPADLVSAQELTNRDRVHQKKRRRREVMGIARPDDAAEEEGGVVWSEFLTADPFPATFDDGA